MKKLLIFIVLLILFIAILFALLYTDFSGIVGHKQYSVKAISVRASGDGVLYSTTDAELINELISIMNSARYIRIIAVPSSVGNSPTTLYDDTNKELARIYFYNSNIVKINNKTYKIIGDMDNSLRDFYKKLKVEENAK